jgi:hypothetical protein
VVPLCKAAGYTLTPIDTHFSDVSKLSHGSLRDYATSILADLAATKYAAQLLSSFYPASIQLISRCTCLCLEMLRRCMRRRMCMARVRMLYEYEGGVCTDTNTTPLFSLAQEGRPLQGEP